MSVPLHADDNHPKGIILDRSMGSDDFSALQGPDYDIIAEYGRQSGTNLFHSFRQFNIHASESATFSGPENIQNIIARVTGGNMSWIYGLLRSDISHADLYLLNPAGVMFGPNVSLDLRGSFHISTADYLRLGDKEIFLAHPRANEVLSVAAPFAFGFLDNDIKSIIYEGKGEISNEEGERNPTGLHVPKGETLSIIGGDIEIRKGTYYGKPGTDEAGNPVATVRQAGDIQATEGSVLLAAMASPGEVVITGEGLDATAITQKGNIRILDKVNIDAGGETGESAGNIFILAGDLMVDDSSLFAKNQGNRHGGDIDIFAESGNISFQNGARILAGAYNAGNGGDVSLKAASNVFFQGKNEFGIQSGIDIETRGQGGNAGDLSIEAGNIFFDQGAYVDSASDGAGAGGEVFMNARNIAFTNGAGIDADTEGIGEGGRVILAASDTLRISGTGKASQVSARSLYKMENAGEGGDISLSAKTLQISDKSVVSTSSTGPGKAGDITLTAGVLEVGGGSSVSSESLSQYPGAGDVGEIIVDADDVVSITGKSVITTDAKNAGGGGITISADNKVYLNQGTITSSVRQGTGNGGDITIGNPDEKTGTKFIVLNQSTIIANADIGDGGKINIWADHYLKSAYSVVVTIHSPHRKYL